MRRSRHEVPEGVKETGLVFATVGAHRAEAGVALAWSCCWHVKFRYPLRQNNVHASCSCFGASHARGSDLRVPAAVSRAMEADGATGAWGISS